MTRKTPKNATVAFKVEEELADFLNKLANKSAFIRKAIVAQLGRACPLCDGSGIVPRGLHDHYAPLLERFASRRCDSCGDKFSVPRDLGTLSAEDRVRLEQFFHGGPFYCGSCYDKVPSCTDCSWHIDPSHVADHLRQAHTG